MNFYDDISWLKNQKNSLIPIEKGDFEKIYFKFNNRAKTGIGGLDDLLAGGIPYRDHIFFHAPTSLEREYFEIKFIIEGLKRRESALIILFETVEEFIDRFREFDFPINGYIKEGMLKIVDLYSCTQKDVSASFEENGIVRSAKDLTSVNLAINIAIEGLKKSISKRLISHIISFVNIVSPNNLVSYTRDLILKLKKNEFTSYFFIEKAQDNSLLYDQNLFVDLDNLFNGHFEIFNEKKQIDGNLAIRKIFSIRRMDNSNFDSGYYPLTFEKNKLYIGPVIEESKKPNMGAIIKKIFPNILPGIKNNFSPKQLKFTSEKDFKAKNLIFWIHEQIPKLTKKSYDDEFQKKLAIKIFKLVSDKIKSIHLKEGKIKSQIEKKKPKKAPQDDLFSKISQPKEELLNLINPLLNKLKRDLGENILDFESTEDVKAKMVAKNIFSNIKFILGRDYDLATKKEITTFLFIEICKKVKGKSWKQLIS